MGSDSLEGVLITGAGGQVGGELVRTFTPLSTQFGPIHAPLRAELDLADTASIRAAIRSLRPRWILNAAAYTAVDRAESEPAAAYAINAEAVRTLGEEAARIGAKILHFSTDYVFDGTCERPYTEADTPNPQSIYGASKFAGEQALASTGALHLILRTSWIYGATGNNFLRTILRLAQDQPELRIVADQHGAPTSSGSLAALTLHILASELDLTRAGGVYHATDAGQTTWFGFAQEAILERQRLEPSVALARLTPISSAQYPTAARRPLNSRLNCAKLEIQLGWRMPDWRYSLTLVMNAIHEAESLRR